MNWKWRNYFKLKEFGLSYDRPQDFVTLQHGPQVLYVVWTALWLAYHLIWILLEVYWSMQKTPGKWMLLLTNLSYLVLATLALVDFACCLYVFCLRPDISNGEVKKLPWCIKAQWILINICGHAAVQVTVLYWALLATSTQASTINKHGINLVYILLVIFLSAKPIKFQHVYMAVLSSTLYIIINLIYFAASGGKILYPFLNWSKPGKTAFLAILYIFVSTPVSFFLLFGLYKLRVFVYNTLFSSRSGNENGAARGQECDELEKFHLENGQKSKDKGLELEKKRLNDGFDKNRNSTEKFSVQEV